MDDGFPALGGVGRTGERPTWGAKETVSGHVSYLTD